MNDHIQIITTVERREDAQGLAKALLEKKMAACVQIVGPMTSMYWWQGEIETAGEFLCLIKSRRELFTEIEETLAEIHPYELPEILAIPVTAGSQGYLRWLDGQVKEKAE